MGNDCVIVQIRVMPELCVLHLLVALHQRVQQGGHSRFIVGDASAECAARHLDPLTTNLVVADASRTEKTICLAVSPSLKSYGIPGRARLFEVVQRVKEVNNGRLRNAIQNKTAVYKDGVPALSAASYDATALAADSSLEVSYLVAPPRMAYYEKVSRQIYGIYLKYIAPEDIVVYSIDEVFIDATAYLTHY